MKKSREKTQSVSEITLKFAKRNFDAIMLDLTVDAKKKAGGVKLGKNMAPVTEETELQGMKNYRMKQFHNR